MLKSISAVLGYIIRISTLDLWTNVCACIQFWLIIANNHLNFAFIHFHLDVFENLYVLDLQGQITSIQDETFKELGKIRFIRFRMQNIRDLFARKNNWLTHINDDLDVDPSDSRNINTYNERIVILALNQLYYNLTLYEYPQEDICFFQNYPHRKLVWPLLKPNFKTSCSCTEIYLVKNLNKKCSHFFVISLFLIVLDVILFHLLCVYN